MVTPKTNVIEDFFFSDNRVVGEYVVKIASRCNLNCSYCYMYNLADKTFIDQPRFMSEKVTNAFIGKVSEHASKHALESVQIILHGGEPLLLGKAKMVDWLTRVKNGLCKVTRPVFSLQSNGSLIDREWIEILYNFNVQIGISLDGPEKYHNIHRVDHNGKGSFQKTARGIHLLQNCEKGRKVFSGVIVVVNTDIAPKELYEFALKLDLANLSILLPHNTYDEPPRQGKWQYGDWMVELFDLWFYDESPTLTIRMFNEAMQLLFGNRFASSEYFGLYPGVNIIVETDGGLELTDSLKAAKEGITKLNLNVLEDEIDAIFKHPKVPQFVDPKIGCCTKCKNCSVFEVCGGGIVADRYSSINGFDNPSVYCEDLMQLIKHIRLRVLESLPENMIQILQSR
jgi:uncharacterized protein